MSWSVDSQPLLDRGNLLKSTPTTVDRQTDKDCHTGWVPVCLACFPGTIHCLEISVAQQGVYQQNNMLQANMVLQSEAHSCYQSDEPERACTCSFFSFPDSVFCQSDTCLTSAVLLVHPQDTGEFVFNGPRYFSFLQHSQRLYKVRESHTLPVFHSNIWVSQANLQWLAIYP